MRAPKLIALARVLAWGAGYGAALIVAYDYAALPDELPLSRWSVAPKSMFFALRVPLINLAMIGLCDLIARSLKRAPEEQRLAAERTAAALLCTAGLKAWLATKQILSWPDGSRPSAAAAFIVVVLGVCLAAWFARPLLAPTVSPLLRFTRTERMLGASLVAMIVVLNLPLVALRLFL
jgi:hypothetical protein